MSYSGFMGTILGVPTVRIIAYWALYWGPIILGHCHIRVRKLLSKTEFSTTFLECHQTRCAMDGSSLERGNL